MKKILKVANFLYISALMVMVVGLLLVNFAKESIVSLLEKRKSRILAKNKKEQKYARKYVITGQHKISAV